MSVWATAISDLRTQLSDGPTDRYSSKKRCFGEVNGSNLTFRSFEFRRITNFQAATSGFPLGVYVNGSYIPATGFSADYPGTGEFTLTSDNVPVDGQVVEASYYSQWFIDNELDGFLQTSSNWLTSSNVYANLPQGLWPCALKYACAEAYLKMAVRWRTFLSEMYRVEDEPNKPGQGPADSYVKMSQAFRKEALMARDEYYTRQGRPLQPLYGSMIGNVRPLPGGN